MNTIESTETAYLAPDKTIDEVVISFGTGSNRVFVYNHKGILFLILKDLQDLILFLTLGDESRIVYRFNTEDELDQYLENEYQVI